MSLSYTLAEIGNLLNATCPAGSESLVPIGVSTDTRTLRPGELFFALAGENHDADKFVDFAFAQGASAAVTHSFHNAGPCLVHPKPLEALQRLATHHRRCSTARVIAITGSCGKTTAKDLTTALLERNYPVIKTPGNLNNDIGCPLSLLRIATETRYAIIEMGANHAGEIAGLCRMAQPDESAVTMVGPAHLEGFGSVAEVAKAKAEIMEALPQTGCFYINADDPYCVAMGSRFTGEKISFGKQGDVVLESLTFDDSGEMVLSIAPVGTLRLPLAVRAHSTNVLLAVAIGLRHNVTDFEGPLRAACAQAARFRIVHIGPWTVLEDAYNANPASMAAALETLASYPGKRKIAVLGDMFELGDAAARLHEEVGAVAAGYGVDWLLALGAHAREMVAAARSAGIAEAEAFENHASMAEAIEKGAADNDVILVKGSRGMKMETVIQLLQAVASSR